MTAPTQMLWGLLDISGARDQAGVPAATGARAEGGAAAASELQPQSGQMETSSMAAAASPGSGAASGPVTPGVTATTSSGAPASSSEQPISISSDSGDHQQHQTASLHAAGMGTGSGAAAQLPGTLDASSRQGSTNAAAAMAAAQAGSGEGAAVTAAAAAEAAADEVAAAVLSSEGGPSGSGCSGGSNHICQVDACDVDLGEMKPYFRRSKVCPGHQAAPTVLLGGVVCRFCQQCTRCHPLDEFDGTKRSCRSQLAHHNKSRKHRRRCTPGSFYSTKRSKPHAAQAAKAKARLQAAQEAAAAAAAAGGDAAAQQAAATAAAAAAAAAAVAEAKSQKAAATAAKKKAAALVAANKAAAKAKVQAAAAAAASSATAAAAAARRQAAGAGMTAGWHSGHVPIRGNLFEHELDAAAEMAAMAAAHQHGMASAAAAAAAASLGGTTADMWGGMRGREVSTMINLTPASMAGGAPGSMHHQTHQQQMNNSGFNAAAAAGALGLHTGSNEEFRAAVASYAHLMASAGMAGPGGAATAAAGSGKTLTGASSGGHNSVAPLATLHQGGGQPGHLDDDAGSSSCCSSRGSPMLQGVRRQGGSGGGRIANPLLSSSSAPPGAVAAYMALVHEGGLPSCLLQGSATNLASSHLPGNAASGPLGGMSGQYQQQLSAAAIGAGAGAGLMHGMPLFRSSGGSSMGPYAAARAAAATAGRPQAVTRTWHAMLPSEAAAAAGMQAVAAGAGSFDSCSDMWGGGGQDAAAIDLMLQKVSRSRMEQTPGSSARQAAAAAAASYQALHAQHQQQLQEMEQLQQWQRLQAHHQAAAESGLFAPFTGAHLPHHAAEAMFHSYSTSAVAAMAAAGGGGAAAAAGGGGAGQGANEAPGSAHPFLGAHGHSSSMPLLSGYFSAPPAYGAAAATGGSAKTSLDAAAATAAELVAMVNPAELLGEDLCWQGAGGGAPTGPGGASMPVGRGGPLTPTTIKQGAAVGGLDAADIADLWNVLGDCDGADKDGLFEPLGDLF